MRYEIRLAAAALALMFASSSAQGFQLEPKGPAAKWRTDIVKRTNKFTTCALTAWQKCEAAAANTEKAAEDSSIGAAATACLGAGNPDPWCTAAGALDQVIYRNSIGNGSAIDCDVSAEPIVAALGSLVLPADISALQTTIDTKCNPIMTQLDESPAKPKGLNAANKLGLSLTDIGCPGDCGLADGPQACADPLAYKTAFSNPAANARATAGDIATIVQIAVGVVNLNPSICGGSGWPDPTGTDVNLGTTAVLKYVTGVGACVQKCQDDLVGGAGGKGGGFRDDTTKCLLNPAGDGAADPTGDGVPFDACVNKVYLATLGSAKLTNTPGWNCLNTFLGLPNVALGDIDGLIGSSVSNATNASFDRVDIQSGYAAQILALAGQGGQALTLSERKNPNQRVAYGACATFGNGILEDYEECDGSQKACAGIPGTLQNTVDPTGVTTVNSTCTANKSPHLCCTGSGVGTCDTCPTVDNPQIKTQAGRCTRF